MPISLPEYIFQKASHYFDNEVGLIIVIKKNDEYLTSHFSPAAAKIWGFTDFEQVQREVIGKSVKTLMPTYIWDAHDKWIEASRAAAIDLRGKTVDMAMQSMGKKNSLPIASRKADGVKAFLKFESFTDGTETVTLVGAVADVVTQEGESVRLVSTFSSFVTKMMEVDIEQAAKKTEKMAESVKKIGIALTSMGAVAAGLFIGIKTFIVNTFNLGNIQQANKTLTALDPRKSEVAEDLEALATQIMVSADKVKNQKIIRAFLVVFSEENGKYYSSFRSDYQWVAPNFRKINGQYSIQKGTDFERFLAISEGRCYSIDTEKLDLTDPMRGALESSGAKGQLMCQVHNDDIFGGLAIEFTEPLNDLAKAEDLLQIEAGSFSRKYLRRN